MSSNMNVRRILAAVFTLAFFMPAFAAAQQPTTPTPEQLEQSRQALQRLRDAGVNTTTIMPAPALAPTPVTTPAANPLAPNPPTSNEPQMFDTPRLLTVWDGCETSLVGDQLAAFRAEDKKVKNPDDVVRLFTHFCPSAMTTATDPKYVDPAVLRPAADQQNPLFSNYAVFEKWRTAPAGSRFTDLDGMRKGRSDVVRHLRETKFLNGLASRSEAIRASWIRRFNLAMDFNWPFALGIAKVDRPSPIWAQGSGKGGVTHPGYKYKPKRGEEHKEVLRLLLLEESLVVENGLDCGGNANVVELDVTSFKVTTTENYIICNSIEVVGKTPRADGVVEFAADERLTLRVREQETGPKTGKRLADWSWKVNGQGFGKVGDDTIVVDTAQIGGKVLEVSVQTPQETGSGKTEKSCSVTLVKLPPPPPPVVVEPKPKPEPKPVPAADTPAARCVTCDKHSRKCGPWGVYCWGGPAAAVIICGAAGCFGGGGGKPPTCPTCTGGPGPTPGPR